MAVHLQFEGIRCFAEPQDAIIRPLTVLVGENSSGKTTFLALCRSAHAIVNGFVKSPLFNEDPFWLGAFEQIASHRSGRNGRAKSFSVAIRMDDSARPISLQTEYVSRGGQPSPSVWCLRAGDQSIRATNPDDESKGSLRLESPKGRNEIAYAGILGFGAVTRVADNLYWLADEVLGPDSVLSRSDFEVLARSWKAIRKFLPYPAHAFSPVRTRPSRTYDPIGLEVKPEGSHVPMLMASLARSAQQDQWVELQSALTDFGIKSGLFYGIEIIDKGKKESDPFQVGVRSGGPAFNLIDVGYGVSQALQILVDTLRGLGSFLLQQPEVHLHPKAQAELGSFFAKQASARRQFVIETHSDYLVDRIRMEVRRKLLRPEDVSLLYFERGKAGATIYNLELDENGTITNPPPGFRQFFLKEERDLLGI
jgi:hypothetical protein